MSLPFCWLREPKTEEEHLQSVMECRREDYRQFLDTVRETAMRIETGACPPTLWEWYLEVFRPVSDAVAGVELMGSDEAFHLTKPLRAAMWLFAAQQENGTPRSQEFARMLGSPAFTRLVHTIRRELGEENA